MAARLVGARLPLTLAAPPPAPSSCSILYRHVPDASRLYVNYMVASAQHWQRGYWGANYERLQVGCSGAVRDCTASCTASCAVSFAVLRCEDRICPRADHTRAPDLQRVKAAVDPLGLFDKPMTVQGAALDAPL